MTTHPSVPPSLLADVFESMVAAIYLDGGDQAARRFIHTYLGPEIELAAEGVVGSKLQIAAPATRAARTRHDAHLSTARRERPRPQQVL